MAHITLKLIWYRLGESFDKMANAGSGITAWLFSDWDDNLLDVLLFGWIGWAALVIFIVNAVLTFFGPLKPRDSWDQNTRAVSGAIVVDKTGSESCQWLNSALNWFYLHYEKFPEFIDAWVLALNEQTVKLGGPVQLKFERVKSGSLPPKFSDVTFQAGPEDKYVVKCKVDSKDLSFAIFASQQTAEGVKLTNLAANILKLKGSLRVECFAKGSDMMAKVVFEGRPDVHIVGKPVNPYQDPSDLVDIGVVEEVVRNSVCLATTEFNLTKWITGESQNIPRVCGGSPVSAPISPKPHSEDVFKPIEAKQTQSAFHSPTSSTGFAAPRANRSSSSEDKRLLIKVIKASGLLATHATGTIDPACVVFMDNPPQSQLTSVVKSSINPFWDEQFLFDLSGNTRELKFEVIDKSRPTGENFLGEAIVYYDDVKRNASSRQIIPLQGVTDDGNFASGSITVEFLFLDPVEIDGISSTLGQKLTSPRRTIQVNQARTPGGTVVTTTTMTTERPKYPKNEAAVDASPRYIEKQNVFDYDISDNTSFDRTSPENSLLAQNRSLSSSEYGHDGYRHTPEEFHHDVPTVTTQPPSPGRQENKDKEKMSFARKIKKRFSRSKKRSHSAERSSSSLKEGSNYLRPPDAGQGIPQAKDDIELVRGRQAPETPNLKKSRSLGGSLKKLFRRGRKQSRSRGETSRESSFSRSSTRNVSQGPSREGSLNRNVDPKDMQYQQSETLIS